MGTTFKSVYVSRCFFQALAVMLDALVIPVALMLCTSVSFKRASQSSCI